MVDEQKVTIGAQRKMDAKCDNCGKRVSYLRSVKYGNKWRAWFCLRCCQWFEPKEKMEIQPYQPEMETK